MNITELHPGLRVLHAQYGIGDIKVITEKTTEVLFNDGRKTLSEDEIALLKPSDPIVNVEGLSKPLKDLIAEVVLATTDKLDLKDNSEEATVQLGTRWSGGKLVLHPKDTSLATKEVELEVFFRKIVSVRDNLRVLEQKINSHPKLEDADRIELQAYITKSYGSLTTFNLLFKNKEQLF